MEVNFELGMIVFKCIFANGSTAIGCSITIYTTVQDATDQDVARINTTDPVGVNNSRIALFNMSSLPVGTYMAVALDVEADGTVPATICNPVRETFNILSPPTSSVSTPPPPTSKLSDEYTMSGRVQFLTSLS